MKKLTFGALASLSGGLSVIILALAAHVLPNYFENKIVSSIITGAEIQLFHAVIGVCIYLTNFNTKGINRSGKLLLSGSLIFSISIYILSINTLIGATYLKIFGPITPIGGILMISGWFLLAYHLATKGSMLNNS
jgi:uncharacterized membrane protein YgdD (TMEM256/DUF423 family)